MPFQNSQRSLDAFGTNPGAVTWAFVVDERDERTGTEERLLQILRITDEDRKAAFVDFLKVRHRTVLDMVRGVVQISCFSGFSFLRDGVENQLDERCGIQLDLDDLRQFFRRTITADHVDVECTHQ